MAAGVLTSGPHVVRLSIPLRLAVPPLLVSSLRQNAIGFSFESGATGAIIGAALLGLSLFVGAALFPSLGFAPMLLAMWGLGTTGAVMLYNSFRGVAFVKTLCSGCRLFPIIVEHETLHLQGEESDSKIWSAVRGRYSVESLGLAGDPKICSFCPIAKRLSEH